MRRKHLPQLTDQRWFPGIWKSLIAEFMTWFVHTVRAAKPFVPVFSEALAQAKSRRVCNVTLSAGAGMECLQPFLPDDLVIEDLPVDVLVKGAAPMAGTGLFCMVNCFHRLPAASAREVLMAMSVKRVPIVILEGNNDNWWQAIGMSVIVPLTVFLTAPFVRPFRVSRLLFTYLLPVLPFFTALDGMLALFKLYPPEDLDELVASLKSTDYTWRSGRADNGRGGKIMYLLGIPA